MFGRFDSGPAPRGQAEPAWLSLHCNWIPPNLPVFSALTYFAGSDVNPNWVLKSRLSKEFCSSTIFLPAIRTKVAPSMFTDLPVAGKLARVPALESPVLHDPVTLPETIDDGESLVERTTRQHQKPAVRTVAEELNGRWTAVGK